MASEEAMRKITEARNQAIRAPKRPESKSERSFREGRAEGLAFALRILAESRRAGSAPEPQHRPAPAVVDLKPAGEDGDSTEALARSMGLVP